MRIIVKILVVLVLILIAGGIALKLLTGINIFNPSNVVILSCRLLNIRNCRVADTLPGNSSSNESSSKVKYWADLAIKANDVSICDNVEGYFDGGDFIAPKEYAVEECKLDFAVATDNQSVCTGINTFVLKLDCLEEMNRRYGHKDVFNMAYCKSLEDSKSTTDFSYCIEQLASATGDDNVCNALSEKGNWFGQQMCLEYYSSSKATKVEVPYSITAAEIPAYSKKCFASGSFYTRATCLMNVAERFTIRPTEIEDYCLNNNIDDDWTACMFMEPIGFNGNSIFKNAGKIKELVLNTAKSDKVWEERFCESIRINTFGSKGIIDGEIKAFGRDVCGLSYLK